jgi:hypothetical protein
MTIPKVVIAIGALALGLAAFTPRAHAALTITASVGGGPAVADATLVTFDDFILGGTGGTTGGLNVSFTGGGMTVTGNSAVGTAPVTASGPDTTNYLTTALGTVMLTFPGQETYIGLLWGSVDTFNTLSFYSGQTMVSSVSGADLPTSNFGDVGAGGTLYVNFFSSRPFDSVVAASGGYAFEMDDVAYAGDDSAPVPEPAAIGLLALGLLGIAYTAARRSARTM